MSDTPAPTLRDLPSSQAEAIEKVCRRFEEAWKSRHQELPRVEAFLEEMPEPAGGVLLAELVRLDLAYRRLRGETPTSEEYRRRFPGRSWVNDLFEKVSMTSPEGPGGRPILHPSPAAARTGAIGIRTLGPMPGDVACGDGVGAYDVPGEAFADGVPGYEILGVLGRGGMGVVYRARQTALERTVALKMILTGGHASAANLARFKTEAEAIARLQHPNIVQIHAVGEHNGLPYFSLEFCPGGSLDQKLGGTPLQPLESAALVEKLAQAVEHAHQKGVIHRDIKPANVLLGEGGEPKVTDFGVARKLDQSGQTHTGEVMGTPSYMAPEQAQGRTRELGPACDVYALGAVLYECLTGRPPFKAATAVDTLLQVTNEEPVPPRQLNPRVPPDLETVCLKCLRKEPGKRYDSALSLAHDLQRFLRHEPILARPAGRAERLARWARRHPATAALLGLTALLLLVIAVGGAALSLRLNAALEQARTDRDAARLAEGEEKAKLFESLVSEARASRYSRRAGQRFGTLEAVRAATELARELGEPPETFAELRNLTAAALALPDLRPADLWVSAPRDADWASNGFGDVDPFFRRLAVTNPAGAVSIRRVGANPADAGEIARLPAVGQDAVPLWAPGGRFLAVWYYPVGRLRVWDTGGAEPVLALEQDHCKGIDFNPDGRQILVAGNNQLRVYDLARGAEVRSFPLPDGPRITWLAHHPRLPQAAVCGADAVSVIDLTTGETVRRLGVQGLAHHVAWHPDGDLLAAASHSHVYVWDGASGRRHWLLEHRGGGIYLSFNGRGDLLSSSGWNGRQVLWNPHTGREVFSTNHTWANPRFGPGDLLARVFPRGGDHYSGPLTRFEEAREYRTLVAGVGSTGGQDYRECSLHPGGRLLAVGTTGGLSLMDLAAGVERAFLPVRVAGVEFEPSGSLLVSTPSGPQRWPVQADPAAPHRLRVGPPQRIPVPVSSGYTFAHSADGTELAASNFNGAYVWHRDRPQAAIHLAPHHDCRYVAVSPDGRLVATGSHARPTLKVWDSGTGELLRELIPDARVYWTRPFFSPDGRWLMNRGGQCWRVDDWSEGPRHPGGGHVAFSPDMRLAAWGGQGEFVSLVEPATGRELARLEDPHQDRLIQFTFSPDGTLLIGITNDSFCVRVWDLRLIRQGLVGLGLDWDAPPYPPAPAGPAGGEPLEVELAGAEGVLRLAGLNNQAWRLLAGPPGQRDPVKALTLIRQASELDPDNPVYLNTLGLALYRTGRYKEAIAALKQSLDRGQGKHEGFDLFFLAMCHGKLGDPAGARDAFDRAVRWVAEQEDLSAQHSAELKQFRAEAEAVLADR